MRDFLCATVNCGAPPYFFREIFALKLAAEHIVALGLCERDGAQVRVELTSDKLAKLRRVLDETLALNAAWRVTEGPKWVKLPLAPPRDIPWVHSQTDRDTPPLRCAAPDITGDPAFRPRGLASHASDPFDTHDAHIVHQVKDSDEFDRVAREVLFVDPTGTRQFTVPMPMDVHKLFDGYAFWLAWLWTDGGVRLKPVFVGERVSADKNAAIVMYFHTLPVQPFAPQDRSLVQRALVMRKAVTMRTVGMPTEMQIMALRAELGAQRSDCYMG